MELFGKSHSFLLLAVVVVVARFSTGNIIGGSVVHIEARVNTLAGPITLTHRNDLHLLDQQLNHGALKRISISISQDSGSNPLIYNVSSSPLLLPNQLKVIYFSENESKAKYEYLNSNSFSCFYADYGAEGVQQLSHFELCNGGFEGEVDISGQMFVIKMSINVSNHLMFTMTQRRMATTRSKCGNVGKSNNHGSDDLHLKRFARDTMTLARPPAMSNASTRYVEMYVVIDHQLYVRSSSDLAKTVQRAVLMINYASSLYKKLNIYLALVGTEVWTAGNKFTVTGDVGPVLQQFLTYRKTQISPNVSNDNAQLIVANGFDGSIVGQASALMCSHSGGAAVSADKHEDNWESAATTLAHELGHNFGLQHDDEDPLNITECRCPRPELNDYKCIMYSTSDCKYFSPAN